LIGGVSSIFLSDLGTDGGLVPRSLRVHFFCSVSVFGI
jgi:hypothetical protein